MAKILHISLFCIFFGFFSQAQNPTFYTGNTGSPSNVFPWGVTAGKGIQWLILPGEFTGATPGFITKLYTQGTVSGSSTWTSLTIKMAQGFNFNLNSQN